MQLLTRQVEEHPAEYKLHDVKAFSQDEVQLRVSGKDGERENKGLSNMRVRRDCYLNSFGARSQFEKRGPLLRGGGGINCQRDKNRDIR